MTRPVAAPGAVQTRWRLRRAQTGRHLCAGPALALAACAALCSACAPPAPPAGPTAGAPVVVADTLRRDVPVQLRTIGNVEAYSTVAIKPLVEGTITAVHFTEGSVVHIGSPLFTIDPQPYHAALARADGALARDEAQLTNAELEVQRADKLLADGVLSQQQRDALGATRDALKAAVRADHGAVQTARLNLGYTQIVSPIEGRTGSVLVQRGNVVKALDGGPLVVINRLDPIYVAFSVPEKHLVALKTAMAAGPLVVQAVLPGDAAPPVDGRLTFVDNQVDRSTGTIRLKATFANRDQRLWPGQFVTTLLILSVRKNAVVVPAAALQIGQAGRFVYVVKPDGTVETRPVQVDENVDTLGAGEGFAVVQAGLSAGETVVTDGQLGLVPGARVAPRRTTEIPVPPRAASDGDGAVPVAAPGAAR